MSNIMRDSIIEVNFKLEPLMSPMMKMIISMVQIKNFNLVILEHQ